MPKDKYIDPREDIYNIGKGIKDYAISAKESQKIVKKQPTIQVSVIS